MKTTRIGKIKKASPSKRLAAKAATHSAWKSKKGPEPAPPEREATAPLGGRRMNLACDGR